MKFYWGLNSIPELKGLPKAQQRQLWQSCWRASWLLPRVRGPYVLLVIMLAIGISLPYNIAAFPQGILVHTVWGGLWGGLLAFLSNQIIIRAIRPVIAARRRAMEPQARHDDGSYHVPPAL